MFLNSFTTYNLYIKKMKKYLKIWLGGRPYSLKVCYNCYYSQVYVLCSVNLYDSPSPQLQASDASFRKVRLIVCSLAFQWTDSVSWPNSRAAPQVFLYTSNSNCSCCGELNLFLFTSNSINLFLFMQNSTFFLLRQTQSVLLNSAAS